MESCSLPSQAITTIPTSLSKTRFLQKPFVYGQNFKLFPGSKRNPCSRKLKFLDFRVQASGNTEISSETIGTISNKVDSKDENLAFVAGATGRVGSRTVRELLKLGFRVRAGVRSTQKAESLVQSVKQMRLDSENASEGTKPVERLEIVECDLEKPDTVAPALGEASVVICCIGASEKEVFDITGPYRIDYQATKNLVDAASVANVNHFILVSSLGTNKVGFPAAILNLFWGVLIWKRKAEEALIASGIPYAIVRPGGMERPTDAYKETHNIILYPEDTLFGGQVSNLQVAELMAYMAKNRSLSYCKVVEVIAETTAPLSPMEELLAKIPSQRPDIYSPKEKDAPGKLDSAPSKRFITEEPAIPTQKEPTQAKKVATQPLSPYTNYEDLKPPASPSPTPPTCQIELNIVDTASNLNASDNQGSALGLTSGITEQIPAPEEVPKTKPLYKDLKPPSSPSPTPSGPREVPTTASTPVENISTLTGGNNVPSSAVEKDSSQNLVYRSPYRVYYDLKPPSSPTPSAPRPSAVNSAPQGTTMSVNTIAQTPIADKPSDGQKNSGSRPRPLSPFTMYEDLKPPTSPIPSPRKS